MKMSSMDVEDVNELTSEKDTRKCVEEKFEEQHGDGVHTIDDDLLAKSCNKEALSSATDYIYVGNTGTLLTDNKHSDSHSDQTTSEFPFGNATTSAVGSLEDEMSSDTQEEELKLRWDDDEECLEVREKAKNSYIHDNNHGCESEPEISSTAHKPLKIDEVFLEKSEKVTIPASELLTETPVIMKNDHGINKPDVMLDIPGMLPDMDEELESMELEMSLDNEKESNIDDTDKGITELLSKIDDGITESLSTLKESELDCKLVMSSDTEDDSPGDICITNKTNLVEAIENEVKLLSDTISSIEKQDFVETKVVDLVDINTVSSTVETSFFPLLQPKVKLSVDTKTNEQDDLVQNGPLTELKFLPESSTFTEDTNAIELQATPNEQREKDIKLKVSNLINSIEEEMQLLDSNDEMEIETSKISAFTNECPKQVHRKKNIDLIAPETINIDLTEISTEVVADLDFVHELSTTSEVSELEVKSKELNESELRIKEEDEIALAVKAIEQESEVHETVPAVTIVNVADQLSEISVIEEDNQPSISMMLDDVDDNEVLQKDGGPVSALIDESEVSIIQDNDDDDELPVPTSCVAETTNNIIQSTAQTTEIQGEHDEQVEHNEVNKQMKSKCLSLEQQSTELEHKSDNVAIELTSITQTLDKNDQPVSLDACTIEKKDVTMIETSNNKPQHDVKNDLVTISENCEDVKDTNSSNITDGIDPNKDKTATCLDKDNIQLMSTHQDTSDDTNKTTLQTLEQQKCVSTTKQTEIMAESQIEPQPTTSTVDLDLNKDSSNGIPDSDALGLLAESTRVMDDDDDDDDFYHDDESNLMTAEHSEDSNHQSDDALEVSDGMETEEKELPKQKEMESNDASMTDNQAYEQELETPENKEEYFQFTISNVTNDVEKDNKANNTIEYDDKLEKNSSLGTEKNTQTIEEPAAIELEKTATETVKTSDSVDNEEKAAKSEEPEPKVVEKEKKSPTKLMSLTISSQQSVWNFVDLEESSEDEIQVVQKPTDEPTTTKQQELQPASVQQEIQKQPDKGTSPIQPEVATSTPAPQTVASEQAMRVEVLDEELLKNDDSKETTKSTASAPSVVDEEKSTVCSQKQADQVKGLEVFTLDSDEDETAVPTTNEQAVPPSQAEPGPDPEPVKRDFRCVNSNCKYSPGAQCIVADAATIAYYDGDKRRRAYVCEDCWQPVQRRNEELMEGIRNFTPLLELDMNTFSLDLVEISDSDSEGEPDAEDQENEKIGEVTAKHLEDNLTDIFNETWVKFQMDTRLAETEAVLKMELRRLDTESKDIQSFLDECQVTTDKIRNELYASFPQEIKQVPPLVLYDTPEQQYCYVQATLPMKEAEPAAPTPTRMSKRRLEAAANAASSDAPAKRPAIPLGYNVSNTSEQTENKIGGDAPEKVDDDNLDVSVVNIISSEAAPPGLPPPGELVKPQLRTGMTVYAMRNSFGSWVKGKILEIMPKGTQSLAFTTCKVKFDNRHKTPVKTVLARSMAYAEPASVRLTIGTRVIANFKDTKDKKEPTQTEAKRESYFSGIVAEVPNPVNNYRYLIFFDDGYAQYASHADTRLVCECSSLVWEEVHPFSREFVREYLLAYPERPMVRLHPFQSLKTEWNGKWWTSRVVAVDASLAQVHFTSNNRYEWIYRGSTRLAPLYLELQAAERHRARPMPRTQAHSRANMPVVEYTRYDEQTNKTFEIDKSQQQQRQEAEALRQRAVAKKSTGAAAVPTSRPPPGHSVENVTSRVVYYTPKNAVKPHKMVPHACGPQCRRTDVLALKDLRTYNPLAKPLLSGWERQIVRYKGQKAVVYRAPCGRRVRCERELHRYLRTTCADLPVDLFDFSPMTHCLAEFVLNKCLIMKKDLSQGKENVPVPCVNYYDETLPEFCLYNTERTPTAGVPLNLDPEFLCGCDCEDDCEDKSKCACWKLTLEGARTIGLEGDNVGYVYKRLPEPLPSGIYECNSRCKCKHTCLNRVAQHPLQLKLQIFKTLNRGWGIRALNDVPKGAFLCVYAGNLLTDATANLDGLNEGDEYLAELDYIEVVEQMKEGYEDDIPKDLKKMSLDQKDGDEDSEPEEESSEDESHTTSKNELEDDDFQPATYVGTGVMQFSKRLRQRKKKKEEKAADEKKETEREREKEETKKEGEKGSNDEDCITISDDDEVREPSSFAAAAGMGANAFVSKYRSVRSLFGEDESCYIMDAKVQGNIGRYLNHSCSPNVFVQNVFVDTHDPRFPWVAFFALSHVRAGTELTWNYNYDVGSVPGKALYCYCGAANCRGRLL